MRFESLNSINKMVADTLLQNQTLCKLLFYTDGSPQHHPDFDDSSALLYTCLFPSPHIPDPEASPGVYLSFHFDDFQLSAENTGRREGTLRFNLMTHESLWRLNVPEQWRPYSILYELDETLQRQRIAGIRALKFVKGEFLGVCRPYAGYQVVYRMTAAN